MLYFSGTCLGFSFHENETKQIFCFWGLLAVAEVCDEAGEPFFGVPGALDCVIWPRLNVECKLCEEIQLFFMKL